MQLELVGLIILAAAALLATVAWIWLLVRAFKVRVAWGLGVLVLPPLALLFLLCHFRRAAAPTGLLLAAVLLGSVPYGLNYYHHHYVDLGPREKMVDGALHITLTGWDQEDYAILAQKPSVVVLQMANADVDDRTLEHLKNLRLLRELDLNGTQVTDEGLRILAELPNLQELRLARTKITDAGFQQHLAAKESLRKLDLTGTAVTGPTKRAWRKAQEGREYLD